ncbi:Hypothetical predicted protein [Cloeon dipterum]|uniref:Protein zwilch n=1 Tax=Cloeon dipterum TaxID=197152 RepID=A0A8S1C429_9INSE|nr:Hypothetical predicted protein [Cloeon dipterum]
MSLYVSTGGWSIKFVKNSKLHELICRKLKMKVEQTEKDVSLASQQQSLLKGLIENHRLEWSKHFRECQPLITLTEEPPSFMRVLGTNCRKRFLVVSNAAVVAKADTTTAQLEQTVKKELVAPVGLEIAGCPLESPFTAEEMELLNSRLTVLNINFFPLDIYNPLPSKFARNILFWYTSVIVICNDKSSCTPGMSVIFGTSSFDCISDTTIQASCLGPLTASELKEIRDKTFMSNSKIVKATLKAEYLQPTHLVEGVDSSENAKADCFHVKMTWNNPKQHNSDIPAPQLAGTVADIQITLQDNFSRWQCGKIWEEINLLRSIAKLVAGPKIESDAPLPAVNGIPIDKTIFEMLNAGVDIENELTSLKQLFQVVSDGARPFVDVTDLIWNLLKYKSDIGEIARELEHTMKQSVVHDFAVQPSNPSDLGKLCRTLYEWKDATLITVPDARQTLLHMLQIGFLKVKRDFIFVAKQSEMMVFNVLTKALDQTNWPKKIEKLSQVFQAFELALRAEEWLHLKKDGLSDLFVKALDTPFLEEICVSMQSHHLSHIITSYEPVIRRWDMELSKGVTTIHQRFVASQYPLFSWRVEKPQNDESLIEEQDKEMKFHCALLFEQKRPVRC